MKTNQEQIQDLKNEIAANWAKISCLEKMPDVLVALEKELSTGYSYCKIIMERATVEGKILYIELPSANTSLFFEIVKAAHSLHEQNFGYISLYTIRRNILSFHLTK